MQIRLLFISCLVISWSISGFAADVAAAPGQSSFTPPPLAGLYAMGGTNGLETQKHRKILKDPNVDGFFLQFNWKDIEPEEGVFDWHSIDSQLDTLKQSGKKASLSIRTGEYTPAWLFEKGAAHVDTKVNTARQKDFCEDIRIPIPWDPIYLDAFLKLIEAFGERYHTNPVISAIKITGINYRTSETNLPHSEGGMKTSHEGKSCLLPDDVSSWKRAGYQPKKVIEAFKKIVSTYGNAFPYQPLVIMTAENAFPPIDNKGNIDPSFASLSTTKFLEIGTRQLGDRFIGQNNGLTAFKADPGIIEFGNKGHRVGYQAAWHVTNDRQCFMSKGSSGTSKHCNNGKETMQAVFIQADQSHAEYVELMPVDILNPEFASAISDGHTMLNWTK